MDRIKDKTLLLLSSVGAVAFLFMALAELKPNRISHGIRYSGFEFLGVLGIAVLLLWVILIAIALYDKRHKEIVIFIITTICK